MRYEVKLTSQAIVQIEAIVQYISKVLSVPETARKWADALQSEIAKLDSMPSRYLLQRKNRGIQMESTKCHLRIFLYII